MNDRDRLEEVIDAYRLRKAQIADPRSILPVQNYLNGEGEVLIAAAQPENPRQTEHALALMLLSVCRNATTWVGLHGKAHGHVATVLPVLLGVYLRQQQQDGKSEEWPLWARPPHPAKMQRDMKRWTSSLVHHGAMALSLHRFHCWRQTQPPLALTWMNW